MIPEIEGVKSGIVTDNFLQFMWCSMRIMKRFTIPDILRTVPGGTENSADNFFSQLEKNGIIGKIGNFVSGRAGDYQGYVLVKDIGPVIPEGLANGCGTYTPLATAPPAKMKKVIEHKKKMTMGDCRRSIMGKLLKIENKDATDILVAALAITLAQPNDTWSCYKKGEQHRRELLNRAKLLNYKIYITPSGGFAVKFK